MDPRSGSPWGERLSSESGAGEQSARRLIRDAVGVVRGRITEVARVGIQPLLQEAAAQVRPATLEELRTRYPGLSDDEVARRLIDRAARTATAVALAIGGILAAQEAVAVVGVAVPPAGGVALGTVGVTALAEVLVLFVIEAKLRADLGVLAGQRALTPRELAADVLGEVQAAGGFARLRRRSLRRALPEAAVRRIAARCRRLTTPGTRTPELSGSPCVRPISDQGLACVPPGTGPSGEHRGLRDHVPLHPPRPPGGPRVNLDPVGRPAEVLLVEDNPSDVALTRHLFGAVALPVNLSVAYDGEEAVALLRRRADGGDGDCPDLVLLDLNLPRMSGLEVLGELKADERLQRIPVIVLTTSSAEQDVRSAYSRHANAYVTKPVDLDQFIHVIGAIEQCWLDVARLPQAR